MRTPDAAGVDPIFYERWSPRAFDPAPLPPGDITAIFEAARWAFSSNNAQPWLFYYETDGPDRDALLSILSERNRDWAQHAPLVGLIVAVKIDEEGDPHPTSRFDTGAAAFSMVMQAHLLGYSSHLMAGISRNRAYEVTGLDPEHHDVIASFVIGRRGDPQTLHPKLAAREHPSDRRPADLSFRKGLS